MPSNSLPATSLSAPLTPPVWAIGLGFAGLIPFVGLALVGRYADLTTQEIFAKALVAYGATIVSFLGAIYWGLVMRSAGAQVLWPFAWGVAPSLGAWLAIMLAPSAGLWVIVALLVACYAADRRAYPVYGLTLWLRMRLVLTVVASASCVYSLLSWVR